MALFHSRLKIVKRSDGRSVVAAAAYRATERLVDERTGEVHDYRNKPDNIHSAILLPPGAPERFADRSTLWNEVERIETRKDAQLAREVEFMLPRELSNEDNIELARSLVQEFWVSRGMIADLNIHHGQKNEGDEFKPHAHVLLTMREVTSSGFAMKRTDWNSRALKDEWVVLLEQRTNELLAARGFSERIDHRSYAERGINIEPTKPVGPDVPGNEGRAERVGATHQRNTAKIITNPGVALRALTEHYAVFTDRELERFVDRHTKGTGQKETVLARIRMHGEMVPLGPGEDGRARFTTREMVALEQRMAKVAGELQRTDWHSVGKAPLRAAKGEQVSGYGLGPEQQSALRHVLVSGDLSLVVGFAGTGKSRMLAAARTGWEEAGYRVRGAALSGIAAEGLEGASGIQSRTLASWELAWKNGREQLTRKDILVLDEAGMIGSRQMLRVLDAANKAGAKVVLVGDAEQLQAIDAGAPFKVFAKRFGAAELTEIRRQRSPWQREAVRELATGRTVHAIARYHGAGMVVESASHDAAAVDLVDRWAADRAERPNSSQMMLAYTRADVDTLNAMGRQRMAEAGKLGKARRILTSRGARTMAIGDRVLFLRNDRELGVKNGTLGTITGIGLLGALDVRLDDRGKVGAGTEIKVRPWVYDAFDHGYAATVHKTQGITVRYAYVLASWQFDRHTAYVALSRHQTRVSLHYGRDDFKNAEKMAKALGRSRMKESTLEFAAPAPKPGLVRGAIADLAERLGARNREEPGRTR